MEGIDALFIDLLDVPASVHSVDGRFLHMNAGAELVSGKSAADMGEATYLDLVLPEWRANVRAQFERAARGSPAEFETVFTDSSGKVRSVRAQHLPLRHGDEVVAVLILAFDVAAPPPGDAVPTTPPELTRRQSEILHLVAAGYSTEDIATRLTLAVETVRNYLRALMHVLNAHSRVEAVAVAHRLGLLAPPPLQPPA